MNTEPNLTWETGSAYDLFVSLQIIHRPEEFGLRPSWAAGVRSRLNIPLRDVLEQSQKFLPVPLSWVHNLPEPKDAAAVLEALEALPPQDRLPALTFGIKQNKKTQDFRKFLIALEGKQRLTANIEAEIKAYYSTSNRINKEFMRALFEAWTNPVEFGEMFLEALTAYIHNFYREEEIRIIPAQAEAIETAQSMADEKDLLSLLEELSSGVRMDWVKDVSTLVLAPSFWGAPFVFFDSMDSETGIILFGARPKGMALVPGDLVPEDLLNALKALADPTRLRILRYLLEGPRSPSELAKVLRLRPPTVVHHLHNLRLAGLVKVTVSPKADRRYAVRMDGVETTNRNLREFLSGE